MFGANVRNGVMRLGVVAAILYFTSAADAEDRRVSGINELVVYDPGLREDGVPEIEFKETDNGTEVDIRPTIHVHRYYYNGDKSYQAAFSHGGPTIAVVNHPRTGKRLYIDVNLPPGAPRIAYSNSDITYTYSGRRVSIEFCRWKKDKVTVHYADAKRISAKQKESKPRPKLIQAVLDTLDSKKDIAVGATGMATKMAGHLMEKANQALDSLPVLQTLQSAADKATSRGEGEIEKLRQKGLDNAEKAQEYIRTNR